MRKRYYLSMLSTYPLVILFGFVYFVLHRSLEIYLATVVVQLVLFGLLNFPGTYIFYKPVDKILTKGEAKGAAVKQINQLAWLSTGWVFFLGTLYVLITLLFFFLFPSEIEAHGFNPEEVPTKLWLSFVPSLMFVYAILPSFITYFLINDFILDLKAKVYKQFGIIFQTCSFFTRHPRFGYSHEYHG